ncbi:leucine--tRNA ligase [Candidatus Saccharibacteria bacterium]|nr:leucine--tRNA ligase [Candidatus Saccharibacteria bacterium]
MESYNPQKIEAKWQKIWDDTAAFRADENSEKPKKFLAEMFPYPSGAGLHVGHVRNFTIVDVLARFYTQQGFNVLRPFGYDTFGLPAENYAIKTGVSPKVATKTNIDNFRKQLKRLGFAIDWSREINTSDPDYYKWTEWCFLKLLEKGLAYQKESYQWFCPVDQTVLANEQVEDGHCWRCGAEVEKKKMKQWFFKITAYADELLEGLDELDWPEKIKTMQKNWIGRSEGAEIDFATENGLSLRVFTTRPDTIFGATFLVLAPEHKLIDNLIIPQTAEKVKAYIKDSLKKTEVERQENKEKTGVFTGSYALNPLSGEKLPIWVSDYVLGNYGEGAIMAVPAHDPRDLAFAEKFDLPIKKVIEKSETISDDDLCYEGEGELVNSGDFTGQKSEDAREKIVHLLESKGVGKKKVSYRMRDWLISRQRYWGCPIPIFYDKDGNVVPVEEDALPVLLPDLKNFEPDHSGHSALAKADDWLKVGDLTRETDTLDGYACSSWYLWRYASPHNKTAAWDPEAVKYWEPLDIYCGGDHAVAHLLYVRFWCKFFADMGLLPFREPIKKLLYNGYINAPDGKKMSKSKGNVIDPLDVINSGYGADTLRTYEMFIGPYNEDAAWSTEAIGGVYRFLNRCWTLVFKPAVNAENGETKALNSSDAKKTETVRHKTIKKVSSDIYHSNFNTAVAALMEYVNELYKSGASEEDLVTLAKLLKPFAPHLASEMLEKLNSDDNWPAFDEEKLKAESVDLIVQVSGKLRAKIALKIEDAENEETAVRAALENENVKKYLNGEPKKVIFVKKNHLVNLVA